MTDTAGLDAGSDWKRFMRKHWRVVATIGVAAILAVAGAIDVFLWFAGNAQSSGLVPRTLGLWTMANLVNFILNAIFWELLLVGIPVVVAVVVSWQLWERLSGEEMRSYRLFRKRSRTTRGGGGVSLFFFIAFCFKVYRWKLECSDRNLDPRLCRGFYGSHSRVDPNHPGNSCGHSSSLVDALPDEEALAGFVYRGAQPFVPRRIPWFRPFLSMS